MEQELAFAVQVRGRRDNMCTHLQPLVPRVGILRHAQKRQQVTLQASALTGQADFCLLSGWQCACDIIIAVSAGQVAMAWRASFCNYDLVSGMYRHRPHCKVLGCELLLGRACK